MIALIGWGGVVAAGWLATGKLFAGLAAAFLLFSVLQRVAASLPVSADELERYRQEPSTLPETSGLPPIQDWEGSEKDRA